MSRIRLSVIIGMLALVLGSGVAAGPQAPYRKSYDVNGDGVVNAVDALCILRYIAGEPATAACPPEAPMAIAFGASTVAVAKAARTSDTETLAATVPAGSLHVGALSLLTTTAQAVAVIDSKGNAYTVVRGPQIPQAGATATLYFFYCPRTGVALVGSTDTITATWTSNVKMGMTALYATGLPYSSPDVAIGAHGSSFTFDAGSQAAGHNAEFAFTAALSVSDGDWNTPTGWTAVDAPSQTGLNMADFYKILTVGGTLHATATAPGNAEWEAATISFFDSTGTVTGAVLAPDRSGIQNVPVRAWLIPTATVYYAADGTELVGTAQTVTASDGTWSLQMEQTAGMSPGGAEYTVQYGPLLLPGGLLDESVNITLPGGSNAIEGLLV